MSRSADETCGNMCILVEVKIVDGLTVMSLGINSPTLYAMLKYNPSSKLN